MQVKGVLIDEIFYDEDKQRGFVESTLYTFSKGSWVSIHHQKKGLRIGPLTLLDERKDDLDINILSFGVRDLATEVTSKKSYISYKERWTIPEWTIYTVVLPMEYVATHIEVSIADPQVSKYDLELAVSHQQNLFFHTVFIGSEKIIFDVNLKIEKNFSAYQKAVKSVGMVKGVNKYKEFGEVVARKVISMDFLFKLLELWSKKTGFIN